MKKLVVILLFIPLFSFANVPVSAKQGMVVTEQYLASQVGVDILKQGGNAIDAAVAVGYALAVVNPCCGNLGGGGFMTIHFANGKNTVINFRERAPLKASKNMFLDSSGNIIPHKSTEGYLAIAVPGTVMGFDFVLQKYGKLSRSQVMVPAIKLAKEGYPLAQGDLEIYQKNLVGLKLNANVENIFLKNSMPFKLGDIFIQKDLAKTLELISEQGAKAFYTGSIAKKIVEASDHQNGVLTLEDFAKYKVEELTPIKCTFHSYIIISAPPPSSGGVTLCEMSNILEGYPLAQDKFNSEATLHYMIEAMRFAFADRNYLGDPNFINNPIEKLLSKNHAALIRKHIHKHLATPSIDFMPVKEGNHTTHYSIIDHWGNAVSVTVTLNSFYGAKVIAGDTGFFLNNEMDDFTTKPSSGNQFGLVQGKNNAIEPGKRPLSSMTPTIVLQNNKVLLVTGSPGGPRIITATLESILNTLMFSMNVQEAVDAKRIHHQWMPDIVYMEPNAIPSIVQKKLEYNGYHFKTDTPWGAVEAIYINPQSHILYGGSDNRRSAGKAVGY